MSKPLPNVSEIDRTTKNSSNSKEKPTEILNLHTTSSIPQKTNSNPNDKTSTIGKDQTEPIRLKTEVDSAKQIAQTNFDKDSTLHVFRNFLKDDSTIKTLNQSERKEEKKRSSPKSDVLDRGKTYYQYQDFIVKDSTSPTNFKSSNNVSTKRNSSLRSRKYSSERDKRDSIRRNVNKFCVTQRNPIKTRRDIKRDRIKKSQGCVVKKLENVLFPSGVETDENSRASSFYRELEFGQDSLRKKPKPRHIRKNSSNGNRMYPSSPRHCHSPMRTSPCSSLNSPTRVRISLSQIRNMTYSPIQTKRLSRDNKHSPMKLEHCDHYQRHSPYETCSPHERHSPLEKPSSCERFSPQLRHSPYERHPHKRHIPHERPSSYERHSPHERSPYKRHSCHRRSSPHERHPYERLSSYERHNPHKRRSSRERLPHESQSPYERPSSNERYPQGRHSPCGKLSPNIHEKRPIKKRGLGSHERLSHKRHSPRERLGSHENRSHKKLSPHDRPNFHERRDSRNRRLHERYDSYERLSSQKRRSSHERHSLEKHSIHNRHSPHKRHRLYERHSSYEIRSPSERRSPQYQQRSCSRSPHMRTPNNPEETLKFFEDMLNKMHPPLTDYSDPVPQSNPTMLCNINTPYYPSPNDPGFPHPQEVFYSQNVNPEYSNTAPHVGILVHAGTDLVPPGLESTYPCPGNMGHGAPVYLPPQHPTLKIKTQNSNSKYCGSGLQAVTLQTMEIEKKVTPKSAKRARRLLKRAHTKKNNKEPTEPRQAVITCVTRLPSDVGSKNPSPEHSKSVGTSASHYPLEHNVATLNNSNYYASHLEKSTSQNMNCGYPYITSTRNVEPKNPKNMDDVGYSRHVESAGISSAYYPPELPPAPIISYGNNVFTPLGDFPLSVPKDSFQKMGIQGVIQRCQDAVDRLEDIYIPNRLIMKPCTLQSGVQNLNCKQSPINRSMKPHYQFTSKLSKQNNFLSTIMSMIGSESPTVYRIDNLTKTTRTISTQTDRFDCDSCIIKDSIGTYTKGTMTWRIPTISRETQITNNLLIKSSMKFAINNANEQRDRPMSLTHMTPAQILIAELSAKSKALQRLTADKQFYADRNLSSNQEIHNHPRYSQHQQNRSINDSNRGNGPVEYQMEQSTAFNTDSRRLTSDHMQRVAPTTMPGKDAHRRLPRLQHQ